ncbi:hypothetical protein EIP86_002892 [Pleurotus ostreatoroseus]|nr:hypothetical protein EIP86_002892 [Pleurotus ostreatoroseus]
MSLHTAFADPSPAISIPVGIVVGLLASFVQSLGLTIQRKSHVLNQALPEGERRVETRRPIRCVRFVTTPGSRRTTRILTQRTPHPGIFISSNLFGSLFQIASLPVVILAPLGAVSLLWNAFFARLILGDVFSPWMALSTLCIAGGAVLVAVFGIVPEPAHSLEDLLALFRRPAFVVYFSLLGAGTVVCLVITHAVEYHSAGRIRLPDDTPPLSPVVAPHTDPTLVTAAAIPSPTPEDDVERAAETTPLLLDRKNSRASSLSPPSSLSISTYLASSHTPVLLAMSYASFSGIIAGMCLILAKSGVELLVLTLGGQNQFMRWETWVLVLGLGVCALLQLWYMHKSLVLADPTLVCPLAFCFYNLSSIMNGLVYFDQFSALSTLHLLLVVLGMVILLAGVWVVSFPPGGNRGIDVGTWGEPEEIAMGSEEGGEEIDLNEPYEDEPLPMVGSTVGSRHEYNLDEEDEGRMIATRRSASPTQSLRINTTVSEHGAAPPDVRTSPTSARSSHGRRQTDSALLSSTYGTAPTLASPTSPSTRRRPPFAAHPHSHSHSTLGPPTTTTPPRASFPPFANPLSPGAGFSIGLSPVSPGFALVPRRRRVTSAEFGVGERAAGRRAVSESHVGSAGAGRVEGQSAAIEVEAGGATPTPGASGSAQEGRRAGKGRWRVMSSLLAFARRRAV